MGRKLILTGTKLTNLSAPKLATIDSILPEAGALMLLDPTHPYDDWGTFDLASTFNLPNLAYDQAKALVPTGTTTTLGAQYVKGADFVVNGTSEKVERSGKGGLHVTFSQTVGNSGLGGRNISVFGGSAINSYILANKGHSFYSAFWGRTTRGALAFDAGTQQHSSANGQSLPWSFYTRPTTAGDVNYPTSAERLAHSNDGAFSSAGKTNSPLFQDIAVSNASAATSVATAFFKLAAQAGTNALKAGSMIFYGFYLEDLTVSGRTYAQVNALVRAKYDKDVKGATGRYYNDTFTAPLA